MLTAQHQLIGTHHLAIFLHAFSRRAGIPRHTHAPERMRQEVPD
jgi:hypothetical protein